MQLLFFYFKHILKGTVTLAVISGFIFNTEEYMTIDCIYQTGETKSGQTL